MGLEVDEQIISTPKLSLSKLPCKPREPPQLLTPPLHPSVSIPFRWEEAPGKPRSTVDDAAATPPMNKAAVARCLELPPRLSPLLHDDARITIMPSPTMVLDGPYMGRSLSLACTFSFRKGPVIAGRDDGLRATAKGGGGGRNYFGSRRWGSFKEDEKFGRDSFDFSQSLGEMFESEKMNVKITRVGRRRSFFNLSSMNSNLLQDIYASFKQSVPWRRRRR